MTTQLLHNNENDINTAGKILSCGGLVAIPTETVYGLAADALNGQAVAKIFAAKGRPMDNPLIVHIAAFEDIDRFSLVREIPAAAYTLAQAFWPGPLTIIMRKGKAIPDEVSAGLDTVAIRFPSHPVAQAVIRAAKTPLAAPSANISTRCSTAANALSDSRARSSLSRRTFREFSVRAALPWSSSARFSERSRLTTPCFTSSRRVRPPRAPV